MQKTKTTPLKRFAETHGLKLAVAKAIVRAAERVFKAGEEYSNSDSISVERRYLSAQRNFDALIKANGFDDYEMPGLWPTLKKGDQWIEIPEK